jgi:hypothetical protein
MMRRLLVILLFSSVCFAQAPTTPKATAPAPTAGVTKTAEVPPSAPVITVPGVCAGKPAAGADCKTEISREEFEKLANALKIPEERKRELANGYAQLLAVTQVAEERGVTKKPEVQELLRFLRMQNVAQLLTRDIREQAANVPPAEIEAYYNAHKGQYTQATLERVFIPKMPPGAEQKVDETAVKAEGTKIAGAAKAPGADFTKLQKQAYDDLKITATPPPTDLKDVRASNVPAGQQKVFELNEGAVSEPIDEPGGVYIYKIVSKKTLTQPEVQQEIQKTLEQQRFQSEMEKLLSTIKPQLSDAYFGPAASEQGPPNPRPRPSTDATPKTTAPSKAPAPGTKSSTPPKTPK